MKLAVAIQYLKLDYSDFRKLTNFEVSLCIIYNRKLGGKLRIVLKISLSPFKKKKNHFPLRGKNNIYLGIPFKLKSQGE